MKEFTLKDITGKYQISTNLDKSNKTIKMKGVQFSLSSDFIKFISEMNAPAQKKASTAKPKDKGIYSLLSALRAIKSMIPSHRDTILPLLHNVLIVPDQERYAAQVCITDLNTYIAIDIPYDPDWHNKPFLLDKDTVSSILKAKDIKDIQKDGDQLIIDTGKSKLKLKQMEDPKSEFPNPVLLKDMQIVCVNNDNVSKFFSVENFRATDTAKTILTGVSIRIREKEVIAAATDGYRLKILKLESECENFEGTLNGDTLLKASKLLKNKRDLTLNLSESHFRLNSDNITIQGRQLEGKFPDYHKIIPKNGRVKKVIDRDLFLSIVNMIQNNRDDRTKRIDLYEHKIHHYFSEDVFDFNLGLLTDDDLVSFNYTHLKDALECFPKGSFLQACGNGSLQPVTFEYENQLTILMPIKQD